MGFVNPFELKHHVSFDEPQRVSVDQWFDVGQEARCGARMKNFLSSEQVKYLFEEGVLHATQPVGNDGIVAHYNASNPYVGSYRASSFSPWLSQFLFAQLPAELRQDVLVEPGDGLDAPIGTRWRPIGINPLMRFIFYPYKTGNLIAHYDAPYIANPDERTLRTFLLYLTTNNEGATRFLHDPQMQFAKEHRDWSDWDRNAHLDEVVHRSPALAGDVVVFDHRVLHDSEPVVSEQKMVLRTDITYARID